MQDGHCEAMHAENSLWVSHQGEPCIWLLLVAQKGFVGPHIRDAALVDILKRMHSVTRLLYGSVQRLLSAVSQRPTEKQPAHISSCVFKWETPCFCASYLSRARCLLCMCYQQLMACLGRTEC